MMDEWCQSALDDPLQVPDDAFVKRKTAPPPAPPPPPPPPAPYVAAISSTVPPSLATEETIVDSRSKTTMNRTDSTDSVNGHSSLATTSIQDALRAKFDDTGALILRKTAQARSPGGTPMRQCSLSQRGELQHELFSKLRSRYNSMNHEDDNDEECCDEDDGRDFDDGPSTTSSAPATPSKSATIGVKKMSKWVDSVKIAGRFRRSNKQQQQQQHQHVTSAMDLFADRAATMQ